MHPFIKFLTTAILILVLLSAGCTDTGDGSGSNPIPAETDTSYPIDDSAQTEDITQEQTPEVKPTEAEKIINHPFDISNPHIDYINIDSSENLFGIDIDEGYKFSNDVNGNYDFYNSDKNMIFQHLEHPHFDLYSELQPEQARALEDQYGNMKSVVMEQIDTDRDGELDKVAVRYEGSEGVGKFTTDYDGFDGVGHYLSLGIYYNSFE